MNILICWLFHGSNWRAVRLRFGRQWHYHCELCGRDWITSSPPRGPRND